MWVLSQVHLFANPWTIVHLAGSSVCGISQARILEWVAISFPSPEDLPYPGIKPTFHVSPASAGKLFAPVLPGCAVLCLVVQLFLTLCDPRDCSPPDSSVHGDSPGKNTGVGCHALLQGIFPSQRSNPGLLCCRQILHHLSHQRNPRMLEWVAYPFSRGSSWAGNQTKVSRIVGGFFTSWATRKAHHLGILQLKEPSGFKNQKKKKIMF